MNDLIEQAQGGRYRRSTVLMVNILGTESQVMPLRILWHMVNSLDPWNLSFSTFELL